MGLAETLGARAARQGRSAPVACGELGTVTVEALPVRELELLLRGSDGQRAVFYAACRELQSAGEELRKAGKIFTPDGIMQFVSDSEATAAARTVLELSGQAAQNNVDRIVRETSEKQNRLQIVQSNTAAEMAENRLASVQEMEPIVPLTDGNRLASVQFNGTIDPAFGQASRETGTGSAGFDTLPESDKKAQAMGILPPERTQNVVMEKNLSPIEEGSGGAVGDALRETESEFSDALHETTSEFQGGNRESLHETESEFPNGLHEMTPEYRYGLHENKSDFGEMRRGIPHESKSEFSETAYETTSELAETVARRLVEGLRRAKWVRGD